MISLPAIEAGARSAGHFTRETDEGPVLAVEAIGPPENPEMVSCSASAPVARDQANQLIHDAGLSALHNVREVIRGGGRFPYGYGEDRLPGAGGDAPEHGGGAGL